MKLFRTMFNLAVLPVSIVKDVVMLLPDMSCGNDAFERTKEQCDAIDESLSK